ncbi:MAG: hypothetical protein LBC39_02265 [Methanobrevibacter sp.]|nr:hypothetical protein [Candidatus Methanovirga aequatorialis]
MIGVYVYNDGVHDIDTLITQTINRLLNEIEKETWSKRIIDKFKNHVKSLDLYVSKIEFQPEKETVKHIKDNFSFFLNNLIKDFEDDQGLLIIVVDINGS